MTYTLQTPHGRIRVTEERVRSHGDLYDRASFVWLGDPGGEVFDIPRSREAYAYQNGGKHYKDACDAYWDLVAPIRNNPPATTKNVGRLVDEIRGVAADQDWTDATLLDLVLGNLTEPELERVLADCRAVAREENLLNYDGEEDSVDWEGFGYDD